MAPPKAVLFDIGGVCVISPMQAIANYEKAHNIPENWVNFAISRSSTTGAWQRVERGETELTNDFFEHFRRDLHDPAVWKEYHTTFKGRRQPSSTTPPDVSSVKELIPPMPTVDSSTLFWMMMIISRTPDPNMTPALVALRRSQKFILGALSNTVPFPAWHPYGAPGLIGDEVRSRFDVFVGSAEVGLRKPDRRIYELAVQRLDESDKARGGTGVTAEEVVFLDDIGENLKMAKTVGLRTIRVWLGRTQEAVAELQEIVEIDLTGEKAKL